MISKLFFLTTFVWAVGAQLPQQAQQTFSSNQCLSISGTLPNVLNQATEIKNDYSQIEQLLFRNQNIDDFYISKFKYLVAPTTSDLNDQFRTRVLWGIQFFLKSSNPNSEYFNNELPLFFHGYNFLSDEGLMQKFADSSYTVQLNQQTKISEITFWYHTGNEVLSPPVSRMQIKTFDRITLKENIYDLGSIDLRYFPFTQFQTYKFAEQSFLGMNSWSQTTRQLLNKDTVSNIQGQNIFQSFPLVRYFTPIMLKNPPVKPQNFRCESVSQTVMNLKWDTPAVLPTQAYKLFQVHSSGQPEYQEFIAYDRTETNVGPQLSPTFTEGQVVKFRLQANNECGQSEAALTECTFIYSVPAQITQVVTETATGSSCNSKFDNIRISWQVPNNGGSQITGFSVQISNEEQGTYMNINECSQPSNGFGVYSVGTGLSCTISYNKLHDELGFIWGSSIWARVASYNSKGQAPYSIEGNGAQIFGPPSQIQNLERDFKMDRQLGSIFLMWDGQNQDERGGFPLSQMKYEIYVKRTSDKNMEPVLMYDDLKVSDFAPKFVFNQQAIQNSKNRLPFNEVTLGTEYVFQMRAINPLCSSPKSDNEILTHRLKPDKPGCVRTLNKNKFIEIDWISPNDNASRINKYYVKVSKTTQPSDFVELDQSVCNTYDSDFVNSQFRLVCRFNRDVLLRSQYGLNMGDTIHASVVAENNVGMSEAAYSMDCEEEAILADPPNSPINLKTDNTKPTDIQIEFTWDDPVEKPKLPILGYKVQLLGNDINLNGVADYPIRSFKTQFPLTLKKTYSFTVTAHNTIGDSLKSERIDIMASKAPNAPFNLAMNQLESNCNQIKVEWRAPDDNGAQIQNYFVSYYPGADQPIKITETTYTIKNLKCRDEIQVQVNAVNSKGTSPYSKRVTFLASQVPDPPSNPKIEQNCDGAFTRLLWSSPLINGGYPIEKYIVEAQNQNSGMQFAPIDCAFDNPLDNSCVINYSVLRNYPFSVEYGGTYCLRVSAQNINGDRSKPSELAKSDSNKECQVLVTVPNTPYDLFAPKDQITIQSIVLEWKVPTSGGLSIKQYNVYKSLDIPNPTASDFELVATVQTNRAQINKGLTRGTWYKFMVTAINDCGTSVNSEQYQMNYNPPTNPDSVLNLREIPEKTTSQQIAFTWQEPKFNGGSPIIKYRIQYYPFGDPSNVVTDETFHIDGKITYESIQTRNIVAGMEYVVQVEAVNQYSIIEAKTATIKIIAAICPSAPIQIENVFSISNKKLIAVQWQPQADGGAPIVEYTVYYVSMQDQNQIQQQKKVAITQTILENLVTGVYYQIYVTAKNKKCESAASKSIQILTASVPDKPMQPIGSYDAQTDTITFRWEEPNNGGKTITGYNLYVLQVRDDGQGDKYGGRRLAIGDFKPIQNCLNQLGKQCSFKSDVVRNVPFNYKWGDDVIAKLTASNEYGESAQSDPSAGTRIVSIPAAPSIIEFMDSTETTLTLVFKDGVHIGGSPIRDYRITQEDVTANTPPRVIFERIFAQQYFFTATDMVYLNQYFFYIESRNDQGYSQKSLAFPVTFSPKIKPNPPLFLKEVPALTTAYQVGLSWDQPQYKVGPAIIGYDIYRRTCESSEPYVLVGTSPTTNTVDLAVIQKGTKYQYYIKAKNQDNVRGKNEIISSDPSNEICVLAAEKPGSPTKLTINWEKLSYVLRWEKPDNGGQAVTGYKVHLYNPRQQRLTNQVSDCSTSPISSETSCSIPWQRMLLEYNLKTGDTFMFQVAAQNSYGYGEFSDMSSFQYVYNKPDAPVKLLNYPKETNENSIYMTWENGNSNGLRAIIGYKVKVYSDFGRSTLLKQENDTEKKIRIKGLTKDTTYFITVTATNEIGDSPESEVLKATAENYATPPGAPNLRNNQLITDATRIGLKWTAPVDDGGAPIIGYKLRWKLPQESEFKDINPALEYTFSTTDQAWTYTVTQLNGMAIQAQQQYDFQAIAQNKKGWGLASITCSIIAAKTPDAPVNVNFSMEQNSIPVTWLPPPNTQGAKLAGYKVEVNDASGKLDYTEVSCAFNNVLDTNCKLPVDAVKVRLGEKIKIRVIAKSNVGDSLPSLPAEKTYAQPPSAPINLRSDKQVTSATKIGLMFEPPTDNRGAPITGYRIYWKEGSEKIVCAGTEQVNVKYNEFQILRDDFNQLKSSYTTLRTSSGLEVNIVAGQQYIFQVQAKNDMGYGDISAQRIIFASEAPSAPTNPTITQINKDEDHTCAIQVKQLQSGSIALQTKRTGYLVYVEQQASGRRLAIESSQVTSNVIHSAKCLFADIDDNKCYVPVTELAGKAKDGQHLNFQVAVQSNVGESQLSANINMQYIFPPSRPISLANDVLKTSGNRIGLMWEEPRDTNGSPVIDYQVIWRRQSETSFSVAQTGIKETQVVLTKLGDQGIESDALYEFKVQARNAKGLSTPSTLISVQAQYVSDHTTQFMGANKNEDTDMTKEKEETIILVFVILLALLVLIDLVTFVVYLVRKEYYQKDEFYEDNHSQKSFDRVSNTKVFNAPQTQTRNVKSVKFSGDRNDTQNDELASLTPPRVHQVSPTQYRNQDANQQYQFRNYNNYSHNGAYYQNQNQSLSDYNERSNINLRNDLNPSHLPPIQQVRNFDPIQDPYSGQQSPPQTAYTNNSGRPTGLREIRNQFGMGNNYNRNNEYSNRQF